MKTLRILAKIMTVALIVCLVFSFAACNLIKGSLKLEAFVVDRSSVKTVYFIGEDIDFSGIKATVRYSDESLNTELTFDDLTITYDDDVTATVGTKQVKVSFMDPHLEAMQETIVQITVKEDPNAIKHDSYVADATGMKTEYFVGDTVDFTGVKIIEKFTNGGADVEMTDLSSVTYEYDAATITATAGTQSITVKYNGESAGSISITVKKPAITSAELVTDGVTLSYLVGDTVSFDGLKAELTYENGQTATVTEFTYLTDLATLTTTYGAKTVIVKIDDTVSGTTVNRSFEVKVDGVVEYLINTESVKLNYLIGDTVSLAGLTVTEDWYFADSVTIALESLTFDLAADLTESAGQKTVNISYNGNVIGNVALDVKIPNVQSVLLNTDNVTTNYLVGDTVSIDGLTALITYENGLTKTVDIFTAVTDLAGLTIEPGDKNIIVSYVDPVSGHTANGNVAIKVDGIVNYTIDTTGMNLAYLENQVVSFDGIKVYANYYYGNVVEIASADLTFDHDADLTATWGNKTVTVKVGNDEAGTFLIKVGEIPTASANTENVDLSYRVGESVALDGLTLTLTYDDGTPAKTVTDFEIVTDLSSLTATAGTKTIVVKYLFDGDIELRASFDITVHGFTYQITQPTKTEYIAGDELDYAGFKVEKVYTDGGENVLVTEYTLEDAGVTATAGNKTILVKVGGADVGAISITVKQNVVTSEVVAGVANGARLGATVDFSGITLTVTYLNGSTVVLTADDLTINVDLTTAGNKNVSVSYFDAINNANENATFAFTVYGIDHYSVDATGMKTSYIVGQALNYDGIKVYAHYTDGGEPVLIDASKLSFQDDGATASAGDKAIIVFVDGKNTNATVNVSVLKNAIVKVELSGYNTRFELGSTISFAGLKVTITYLDETVVVLEYPTANDYNLTVSAPDANKEGKQTVSVNLSDVVNGGEGYNTTFEIEVFYRPTISAVEKPDTLTAFESDNNSAGTLEYGQTGFSGQFLNKADLYVIGDDNEFKFVPTVTIDKNGVDTDLDYFYADVDIYIHNGTDYVLLTKTALNKTTYAYSLGDVTYATVDTYFGNYKFERPIERVKISVKPSATDYKGTENFNPVVLEAKVIDAYNVYEAWQLAVIDNANSLRSTDDYPDWNSINWNTFKSGYGILEVNPAGVVLHNDIKVTYKDVPSSFFYKSNDEVQYRNTVTGEIKVYKESAGMNYLIDGTVLYKRTGASDFTIQGNFFTIDASDFPLVASTSIFGADSGKGYGGDYSNACLFMFQTTDTNWLPDSAFTDVADVVVDNVAFRGNAGRDNWVVEKVHGENVTTTAELVTAGGLILLKSSRHANTVMNNCINNSFFISYFPDYQADLTVNDSKCYDSYQNGAFVWSDVTLTLNNTYINGTGGPVIITMSVKENDVYYNPVVNVTGGNLETHVSGEEIWFTAVGANALVPQMKALGSGVNAMIQSATGGAFKGNWVDESGKMNIEAILMPRGNNVDALNDGMIQGTASIDGVGIDRWYDPQNENFSLEWATILQNPAFAQGAPFITAFDQNGNAHTLYLVQVGESGTFYDVNNKQLGTDPSHQAIIMAFATTDKVVLHQGGLSVVFEFYH